MDLIIVACLFIVIFFLIIYFHVKQTQNITEEFKTEDTKLYIKKTQNYDKVFQNEKYTIWIPKPKNDYYPIGNYISLDKKPPKEMAILVKNNMGLESKDKPIKYDIISITNDNYAIWNPISQPKQISLGHIVSKEYPSKYLIRTVPKKWCEKSNVNKLIVKNKISSVDKGYELWNIDQSNLFVCNNLNNDNVYNIKKVYKLNDSYLDTEKKLYIKTINSYKKICSYNDTKLNKNFYIWRPVTPKNFCSLGDIILTQDNDPNKTLDTIVVHKSFCKIPINYGSKSIYKIKQNKSNLNIWRPKPHNDYYFFGDIVVIGDGQPEADNLIYSISVDYIKQIKSSTHKLVYNNVSEKNPLSIWSDKNNFFVGNNSYNTPNKNNYELNMNFTKTDFDLTDIRKPIKIIFKKKKNVKKINNNDLLDLIKKTLSDKVDIHYNRLNDISIKKNHILLNIDPKRATSSEPNISKCIKKLSKLLQIEPLKIYNKNKDSYYISLFKIYNTKDNNILEIDNSQFNSVIE